MSTYYCKKCNASSWNGPFKDNLCDDCWKKMPNRKYRINYVYQGEGTCEVMARGKDEAHEKFFEGDFRNDDDSGYDYEVYSTILLKGRN